MFNSLGKKLFLTSNQSNAQAVPTLTKPQFGLTAVQDILFCQTQTVSVGSLKSLPLTSVYLPSDLSGQNSSGSVQILGSHNFPCIYYDPGIFWYEEIFNIAIFHRWCGTSNGDTGWILKVSLMNMSKYFNFSNFDSSTTLFILAIYSNSI
ncbi:hypothetical protein S83_044002 [Arachis hypogaea]